MPIGQSALDDAQGATIRKFLYQRRVATLVCSHPLSDPFIHAPDSSNILPLLGPLTNNVFKARSTYHQVGHFRIGAAVLVVADHQAVLWVVKHKGFVNGFYRANQQCRVFHRIVLRLSAVGDVDAYRYVFFNPSIAANEGRNEGVHPVIVTVFSPVADLPAPRHTAGNDLPHLGPELRRLQPGVDEAMVLPHKLRAAVTADQTKRVIDFSNQTTSVGNGHDGMQIERRQQGFVVPQGSLQVLGHSASEVFCAAPAVCLLVQHGCQQAADQCPPAEQHP